MILALGILCAVMGAFFLFGCFTRVDSPAFVARAAGDETAIAKLRSLQDAWDKLGKARQFFASSSGFLIMGVGSLILWYSPALARYYWAIPMLFAANLVVLLQIRRHAVAVLDPQSVGHAQVLRVIKQNIRMCITFSIIFVFLAMMSAKDP